MTSHEGRSLYFIETQCFSFTSISKGKTLPRWLKIMKSELAGKETILHPKYTNFDFNDPDNNPKVNITRSGTLAIIQHF